MRKIKNIKNKKAEITTQQIVLLIVLIASFAVILFFILRINPGKTSEIEVCHNSVITRGTGVLPTKEILPLNCKTSYVCLTKDGSCEQLTSPKIEKIKTQEQAYSFLANQMADCWWMFGEGEVNYLSKDLLDSNLYCSICSQLAFDDSLNGVFPNGEINRRDFYDYLSRTNISGKEQSYLDYIVGVKSSQEIKSTLQNSDSDFGKITFGKQYYLVMGTVADVSVLKWALLGVGVGAGLAFTVMTAGVAAPVIVILLGVSSGGTGGYFAGTMVQGTSGSSYLTPTIIEANSQDFASLNCKDIKTIA